jgi:hypothetical protein
MPQVTVSTTSRHIGLGESALVFSPDGVCSENKLTSLAPDAPQSVIRAYLSPAQASPRMASISQRPPESVTSRAARRGNEFRTHRQRAPSPAGCCSATTSRLCPSETTPTRMCPPDTLRGGRWRFLAVGLAKTFRISRRSVGFKSPPSDAACSPTAKVLPSVRVSGAVPRGRGPLPPGPSRISGSASVSITGWEAALLAPGRIKTTWGRL